MAIKTAVSRIYEIPCEQTTVFLLYGFPANIYARAFFTASKKVWVAFVTLL